ncbi:orotidine-5'-phosphate decarboxylase [Terribacillus saccharophilus]|uniref:orotidine-5'-phosphate decarboxylase n=1 Tax=Terribacillus saccharophilus TaxID=361277 RepID=UPI0039821236
MQAPIYLALDFPTGEEALHFLRQHELAEVPVKVGMELFYREGPSIIHRLKENNHPIFLDLKLHDIPNTVKSAMRNLAGLDVDVLNVHALGGAKMIESAKEGLLLGAKNKIPKLIAVTMLTSMDEETVERDLKQPMELVAYALHLAELSSTAGADGVVCSPHEAASIKAACGPDFLTVTPGIRLAGTAKNDQHRIATPASARKMQADYLVVGRSVTAAADPKQAYKQVIEEWNDYDNYN